MKIDKKCNMNSYLNNNVNLTEIVFGLVVFVLVGFNWSFLSLKQPRQNL